VFSSRSLRVIADLKFRIEMSLLEMRPVIRDIAELRRLEHIDIDMGMDTDGVCYLLLKVLKWTIRNKDEAFRGVEEVSVKDLFAVIS